MTPSWTAWVVVAMNFVAMTTMTAPQTKTKLRPVSRLRSLIDTAHDEGDYKLCVELGLDIENRQIGNEGDKYDLACSYALIGDSKSAVVWLQRTADEGWSKHDHAAKDKDLDSIREADGYQEAMDAILENKKAEDAEDDPVFFVPSTYNAAKAAPLIVALHGFASEADSFLQQWRSVSEKFGAIVVAPRAPETVGTRGDQWGWPVDAEPWVFDAIDRAQSDYTIDERRIILAGYSAGGVTALSIGMRERDRIVGILCIGSRFSKALRIASIEKGESTPRVALLVGSMDAALAGNRRLAKAFHESGTAVQVIEMKGVGHRFPTHATKDLNEAVRFALGG